MKFKSYTYKNLSFVSGVEKDKDKAECRMQMHARETEHRILSNCS